MSETVLKQKLMVPVGRSVYTELRRDNCAYADKTVLIPTMERLYSRYPFIIRPRRFGKSLFMSMLETYYDRAQKEDFDQNLPTCQTAGKYNVRLPIRHIEHGNFKDQHYIGDA